MAQYRCYFLALSGAIMAAEDLEASDDEDAIAQARKLHAVGKSGGGFEVWQRDRKVHVEPAPSKAP